MFRMFVTINRDRFVEITDKLFTRLHEDKKEKETQNRTGPSLIGLEIAA